MKRLLLALGIAGPLAAQWTTFDAANYGVNLHNLQQAINDSQKAVQYYQMARDAASFVHNPAAFLSQASNIAGVAISDSARAGWTTQKKADQLRARLQMGQVLMNESTSIATLSHGNASNVQGISVMLQSTSEELARVNALLQHEQRTRHYMDRNQYQDQGEVIAAWRLK
jgi:hypothetical protein